MDLGTRERDDKTNELYHLVVESLDKMVVSVPSDVKYKYGFMATANKGNLAFVKRQDRFYKDENPPPPPPLSNHTLRAEAFQVTKESERTADHAKRDMTTSDHNLNFCKTCRRMPMGVLCTQ